MTACSPGPHGGTGLEHRALSTSGVCPLRGRRLSQPPASSCCQLASLVLTVGLDVVFETGE